jgi:hypothetical protein
MASCPGRGRHIPRDGQAEHAELGHHACGLLHQAIEAFQQCRFRANVFCNAHRYFLNS